MKNDLLGTLPTVYLMIMFRLAEYVTKECERRIATFSETPNTAYVILHLGCPKRTRMRFVCSQEALHVIFLHGCVLCISLRLYL
jgi:hypothetical protein